MSASRLRVLAGAVVASLLSAGAALAQGAPPPAPASAPAGGEQNAPAFKPEELDQMLAQIALYPDALLAQMFMAATYPTEVVQADRWLKDPNNAKLKGDELANALQPQPWDPSVKSLVPFPQILDMMSEKLDWTQRLGDAVLAQQADVMASVQRLRKQAQSAGTLKSTEQQKVSTEGDAVIIQPADPQTVSVPVYDPSTAYPSWPNPSYPPTYYPPPPAYAPLGGALVSGIGFAAGVAVVGSMWGWGDCNWNGGNVNVNYNTYNNINRTNIENGRAQQISQSGNKGNWQHQADHRGGVAYRDQASRQNYQRASATPTAARQNARGYDAGAGRPGQGAAAGAGAGRPSQGGAGAGQGAARPSQGGGARPSQGAAGAGGGARPSQGGGAGARPSTQPSAFGGMGSGNSVNAQSNRGASSRSASAAGGGGARGGGGGGGAPRGGGGGGRGGGGRR
jgi:hypothetical protein